MDVFWWAIGVLGSYILVSLIFLKFPVFHKKKRLTFKCAHISHRGGGAERLENTLEAYRNAIKCGSQMLELDVHLTADEIVVVSHDDHLVRTTGEDVCIKKTFYKDLPPLLNSIPVMEGVTCHRTGTLLRICTLEDVFKEFQGVPIHLDVKTFNLKLIEKTNLLIKKYNRENITPWAAFSSDITNVLYKTNPSIPLAFATSRVIFVIASFWLGILPFVPIKESLFAIPMGRAIRKSLPKSYLSSVKVRIFLFFTDFLLLSKNLFKHLTDRGINVYLWVVNEEDDFQTAFELGATGVMTDYPRRLQKWLEVNDKYKL